MNDVRGVPRGALMKPWVPYGALGFAFACNLLDLVFLASYWWAKAIAIVVMVFIAYSAYAIWRTRRWLARQRRAVDASIMFCMLCEEEIPDRDYRNHARLFHPDVYEQLQEEER